MSSTTRPPDPAGPPDPAVPAGTPSATPTGATPGPDASAPMGVRDVLRLPDFRRLFAAQAISDLGDGMTLLALFLLVLDRTGSTAAIALMSILVALPPVTIGLVAGAYADRLDRRRIMVVSDTARAGVVLLMMAAAAAGFLAGVFALACLQAVIGTFFSPARAAMVPRVVPAEGLLAANSISQASRMVAGVAGTGITGVIAATTGGVLAVFVADAATFLVSVGLVLGVSRAAGVPDAASVAQSRARGVGGAVADGLRVIGHSRPLIATLSGIAVVMLGVGAMNVLFVPFLVDELGESPAWAGPVEGAQTVAMIVAGGFVAALAKRLRVSRIMVLGMAGIAVLTSAMSLAGNVWVVMAILFGIGLAVMPVQAATMTLLQRSTTDGVRGRVSAAFNAAMSTTSIVSMAAAGILADVVGMRTVFLAGGAIAGLGAFVAWVLFRGTTEDEELAAGTRPAPVSNAASAA